MNPLYIICKLGLHNWHTSPNGMYRLCTICNRREKNLNLPSDPIKMWREVKLNPAYVDSKDKDINFYFDPNPYTEIKVGPPPKENP